MRSPINLILALLISGVLVGCGGAHHMDAVKAQKAARLHYQLGIEALRNEQLPRAFDELMTADRLNPGQPEVLDALGLAWRMRGDLKKAEHFYRKSLQAERRAITLNNYANLLLEMKKYKKARRMALEALEDPRYPRQDLVYLNLGDAEAALEHDEAALKAWRRALRFNPDLTLAVLHEAEFHARKGRFNYANALYRKLIARHPDDRTVLDAWVRFLESHGRRQEALQALRAYAVRAKGMNAAWARDEIARLLRGGAP
ncbi:MAG: tetratricopeptide repeat protein [Mariprofundaceae bacterium]